MKSKVFGALAAGSLTLATVSLTMLLTEELELELQHRLHFYI